MGTIGIGNSSTLEFGWGIHGSLAFPCDRRIRFINSRRYIEYLSDISFGLRRNWPELVDQDAGY